MFKAFRGIMVHVILASLGFAAFNVLCRELVLWLPGLTTPSDLPAKAIHGFQHCQKFQWDPQHIPLVKGLEVVHSPLLKQAIPDCCIVERRVGFRPQWFIPTARTVSAHPTFIERYAIARFDSSPIFLSAIDEEVHVKVLRVLIDANFRIRNDDDLQVLHKVIKEILPHGALSQPVDIRIEQSPSGRSLRTVWTRRYRPDITYLVRISQHETLDGASVEAEFLR